MQSVLAYSEDPRLAAELSTAAARLAESLGGGGAVLVQLDHSSPHPSATPILVVSSGAPIAPSPQRTADALLQLAAREGSSAILLGATRTGRQVAARMAVRSRQGVLSDVRELSAEPPEAGGSRRTATGSRAVFAGKFNARVSSGTPCIATIPAGAYEPPPGEAPDASIQTATLEEIAEARVKHLETRPKAQDTVDLRAAKTIVSAGRGFKKKEDLVLVEDLARAMGGTVGASRPLSSDLGWLGEERHIGLTGIYVRPNLYIAVGISGQLQHVAGIKDSRIIVAINKDKQAPIFQVSDYGIVGDLYQVVPALTKAVESRKAA